MHNHRVSVYAICKNEAQFVSRWMDSMAEADEIVVLDTGSTDETAELLRGRGAKVWVEEISPWRFDVARNRSLELVGEDAEICVCTDLDEVFQSGWREKVEQAWREDAGQLSYRYTWSFLPDGREGVVFRQEKIHARRGYRWAHPVHEVLRWVGEGKRKPILFADGVQLDHHPDGTKSRGQYLPLLELSVAEDPADDRNMHYLGREYLYHHRWDDCIRTLQRHLALPGAVWKDERAASMRYIAKALLEKGEEKKAWSWYLRAVAEAPHLREALVDLAMLLYRQEQWDGVLYFTGRALEISTRGESYISEPAAWGSLPHDLRAMAFYRTGRLSEAAEAARLAAELEPDSDRLAGNAALLDRLAKEKEDSR